MSILSLLTLLVMIYLFKQFSVMKPFLEKSMEGIRIKIKLESGQTFIWHKDSNVY